MQVSLGLSMMLHAALRWQGLCAHMLTSPAPRLVFELVAQGNSIMRFSALVSLGGAPEARG